MRPRGIDAYLWPLVKGRRYAAVLAVMFAGWIGILQLGDELPPPVGAALLIAWVVVSCVLDGARRRYQEWTAWLSSAPETRPGFRRAAKGS